MSASHLKAMTDQELIDALRKIAMPLIDEMSHRNFVVRVDYETGETGANGRLSIEPIVKQPTGGDRV